MSKFTIQRNQTGLLDTDDEDEAYAFAEKLASDDPGVTYDVLERISQSSAAVPEKPVAIAETVSTRTGERIAVKQSAVDAVAELVQPVTK